MIIDDVNVSNNKPKTQCKYHNYTAQGVRSKPQKWNPATKGIVSRYSSQREYVVVTTVPIHAQLFISPRIRLARDFKLTGWSDFDNVNE